jgi:indolepyruvate decarboxylase
LEGPVVVVDAGNLYFGKGTLPAAEQAQQLEKARLQAAAFALAGIDAMLPGGDGFTLTRTARPPLKHDHVDIILDNGGYGTERVILDGPFNDINPWRYEKLPEVLGGGTGYEARTEGDFDRALTAAMADTSGISVIRAHLARDDFSTTVRRLGESLSERLRD